MVNKKAFTLIEMMAAIVVLGIVSILIASIFTSVVTISSSTSLIGETRDDIYIIERTFRSIFESYDDSSHYYTITDNNSISIKEASGNIVYTVWVSASENGFIFAGFDGEYSQEKTPQFAYQCKGSVASIRFDNIEKTENSIQDKSRLLKCTVTYANGSSYDEYTFLLTKRTAS